MTLNFKDYILESSKYMYEAKADDNIEEDQDEITEATDPADKAKIDAATKTYKSTKKIPKGFGVAFGKLYIKKDKGSTATKKPKNHEERPDYADRHKGVKNSLEQSLDFHKNISSDKSRSKEEREESSKKHQI